MKNYILDGKGEESYIAKVIECKDGSLSVKFADGRVFNNVEACDENLQKIIAVQEEQALKGIEHYKEFKTKECNATALTVLSGIGALGISTGVSMIPAVQTALSSENPVVVAAGIGVITILGTIPALTKLCREKKRVKELDKLRYRKNHLSDLKRFKKYPNSLAGVDTSVAEWMKTSDDPFCILNIDEYSRDDLEQIMSNIRVEKEYDFTYEKGKSRSH